MVYQLDEAVILEGLNQRFTELHLIQVRAFCKLRKVKSRKVSHLE